MTASADRRPALAPELGASSLDPALGQLPRLVARQREFFQLGYTRSLDYRRARLEELRRSLLDFRPRIEAALAADLGKPIFESFGSEIGFCLGEIDHALKHLGRWAKPRRVGMPLAVLPASGAVHPEPKGVVLILGAWNYPLQLCLAPLVGAIAAGNCAVVKPSETAPEASRVVAELLNKTFDPMYVAAVEGGVAISQAVLDQRFDHIFFTGGPTIAKIVLAHAAKHLTPVTLELGGKSPCIVDGTADLDITARRIVWGKFTNAGQTCLAPDYVLVDRARKAELCQALAKAIQAAYGTEPAESPDYGRIGSEYHLDRLTGLLQSGQILFGGRVDHTARYLDPTLVDADGLSEDDPLLQAEIFGPILPIVSFEDLDGAIAFIRRRPIPLALYLFSQNRAHQAYVQRETQSGGLCFNDVVVHCIVPELPFGGLGESGMGSYHGQAGFKTFSHLRSVLRRSLWPDVKLRYAPYAGKLAWLEKLMG